MSTAGWIGAGIACIIVGYLIADKYSREGYNFWKTFITSSAVLFAIVAMFINKVLGG